MPLKSIKSITAVRSSPVTAGSSAPRPSPAATCVLVTTPSISTCGVPLTVATTITRTIGIGLPPASRNSVGSGERLLSVNDS